MLIMLTQGGGGGGPNQGKLADVILEHSLINEVRLSSGKVLKGGVEGMGRYELELNELIDRFMRLC